MAGATQELIRKGIIFTCDFPSIFISVTILLSTMAAAAEESVAWYRLEPQLLTSNGSQVSTQMPSGQRELVVCVWTRVAYFRRPSVALSVGSREDSIGDVSVGLVPRGLLLKQGRSVRTAAAMITPLTWYHLCLTLTPNKVGVLLDGSRLFYVDTVTDYMNGDVRIILGGGIKWPEVPPSTFSLTGPSDESWDNLVDGSDYRKVAGSFAGDFLDPKVWNMLLTSQEINKLSECQDIGRAPLSNLPEWRMEGTNIQKETISSMEPCLKKQFDYILFPEPMKYVENVDLCVRMDMVMISPAREDLARLQQDALTYRDSCANGERLLWLATTDESCFSLSNSKKEVSPCSTLLCGGCQLKRGYRRLFILRGLCPLPDLDFAFVAVPNYDSRPYFQGTERYNIKKNGNIWELADVTTNSILATMAEADPIGTRTWTVAPGTCGNSAETEVEASLSACQMAESACRSGICIPKSSRCDGYPHCPDGFDEENCQPVRAPKGYLDNAPPPNPPVEVTLSMEVTRLVSTEPLLLLLNIHLSWEDPRLSFANLKGGTDYPVPLNTSMWRPRLMVLAYRSTAPVDMVLQATKIGTDGREKASASLTARTFAVPVRDKRDAAYEDTIYPGTNTTITLSEYVLRPVDCYFDLSFYPFDVHVCELTLVLVPHGIEHARLVIASNGARYTGKTRLSDFIFDEVKVKEQNAKLGGRNHSGVVLQIRLSRRSSYIIVSVILPSLLLLCIITASLWMTYPSKNPTRLIVSCSVSGAFLVLWLIATLNSPVTGKVKALDVWLCFCTMHSILHALLHVFLDIFSFEETQPLFSRVMSRAPSRMREVKPVESGSIYDNLMRVPPENEETWTVSYWITFIARVVSPALVVLFNAGFWPFVIYFSRNPLP